jgi:uncharacterized protein (DUF362 family)/ferredoxin
LRYCPSYERELVLGSVKDLLDPLGGMRSFVSSGERVLIKPNLLGAWTVDRRVTTDPEVVRAVVRLVKEAGGIPFVGDSPALGSFKRIAAKTGVQDVCDEEGVELIELSNPKAVSTPPGSSFRRLELAEQALEADAVISLPKLKTHGQMLLTLGVKNLFGTVVGHRKAEWHHMAGVDRDTFASLLLDIYVTIKPRLTILDGVWAMEGHGPSNGSPKRLCMLAASQDAVALDTAVCRMLGITPGAFPLFRVASSRGIGETDGDKIVLVGDDASRFNAKGFEIPRLDSMGILPLRFDYVTRRLLVSKPVHDRKACAECGLCLSVCPVKAIRRHGRRLIFDYDSCIRCYCCQEICSHNAIGFKKGLIVKLLNRMGR